MFFYTICKEYLYFLLFLCSLYHVHLLVDTWMRTHLDMRTSCISSTSVNLSNSWVVFLLHHEQLFCSRWKKGKEREGKHCHTGTDRAYRSDHSMKKGRERIYAILFCTGYKMLHSAINALVTPGDGNDDRGSHTWTWIDTEEFLPRSNLLSYTISSRLIAALKCFRVNKLMDEWMNDGNEAELIEVYILFG